MRRLVLPLILGLGLIGVVMAQDGPLTNFGNLPVRTDSNGYLLLSAQTYTGPDGPRRVLANSLGRTDANGYLIVTNPTGIGAPTTAQYWLGAANATLSSAKNLGALSTGLVLNTSGVPSTYAGVTCSAGTAIQVLNASGAGTCASAGGMSIGGTVTSGTTGSLLFIGAGPVLAQDNANAFWDVGNHRLGIGTAAPGTTVEINGITSIKAAAASSHQLQFINTGATVYMYARSVSGNAGLVISATGADTFYFNPDGLFGANSVSVGTATISTTLNLSGTDSPTLKFNRAGTSNLARMQFQTAAVTDWFLGTKDTTSNFFLESSNTGSIGLVGNWSLTKGHYGIGTSAFPTTGTYGLLFADGTALATMGSNTAGLYGDDVGGTVRIFGIDEAGVTGALVMASGGLTSGRVPVSGANGLLADDADLTFATDTLSATKLSSALLSLANTGGAATSGQLTLIGGTLTVNTTAMSATALLFAQRKTAGGTIGFATTYTQVNGTSFTLTSDSALDTSTYNWWIVETH